jgi:hypothetical protein
MESTNKKISNINTKTKFQNLTYEFFEKTAIENKPKISDIYEVGYYCDALDETKNFCVGEIMENKGDQYKVHFEGWSNKHDIIVAVGRSKKIEYFRKFTKGYTGQKMTAYRVLNFQKEDFLQFKNTVKAVKEIFTINININEIENIDKDNNYDYDNNNFLNNFHKNILDYFKDAYYLSQILRGRMFFKLDYFMTNPFNNQNAKEYVPEIVNVIYDYLDFAKGYFKLYKEQLFLTEINKKFTDLFLVDKSCAISASYYEVLHSLRRIFGKDDRVNYFYKVNNIFINFLK